MNRLRNATSPYLRQHADNPVDWWQWGPSAIEQAKQLDVPILLSVGYAACHWCHVMAHESFEDPATATLMNNNFICIKVDREERPDIDSVYMNATVAMIGQGGWPMTCFLTPEGEPFLCGTYYPKTPRGGMPSFTQVLEAVARTWTSRRAEVVRAASGISAQLRKQNAIPRFGGTVGPELLDAATANVLRDLDHEKGGFGGAPKFPPSSLLEGLLRSYERTGDSTTLDAVAITADAMARGGIYDQLKGGFARYSVDADWVVPHFEKMLYDNALLLRAYTHLGRLGYDFALRISAETAEFLLADLRTSEGGFASALDADTDGVEGLTYVWTPEQLDEVLDQSDSDWAADLFHVTVEGTFEEGASVLQLLADPDDPERFARVKAALLKARESRPQPARDDKVVTAWNGMAIAALAEAGAIHGRPEWIAAAVECAEFLLDKHVKKGRVRRSSLGGAVGKAPGVLEDYAWLATGLLTLNQVTGQREWLTHAQEILQRAINHFEVPGDLGSWYDTADDAESLITRPRDAVDGATPAGASSLAEALQLAAALSDPAEAQTYRDHVAQTVGRSAVLLARASRSAGHWLAVAEAEIASLQVAVATDGDQTLVEVARRLAPGGAVVVAGPRDSMPLLTDRGLVDGQPAAYVCRGYVCDLPVTTVEDLAAALKTS
ncbi:thioredoxin domain-containing protein [Smaragdicoccus niigatensis]|uniref:thioredoxin domain-containing protein n=1 Tax=Smaragdicoccus niigatensis TaxID=359359 RepID=UPI000368F20B|nr:thioredoxin domain-containing protein [Smaragdicoccus niigatensis]